jgi:hypothetical protein
MQLAFTVKVDQCMRLAEWFGSNDETVRQTLLGADIKLHYPLNRKKTLTRIVTNLYSRACPVIPQSFFWLIWVRVKGINCPFLHFRKCPVFFLPNILYAEHRGVRSCELMNNVPASATWRGISVLD